MHGSAKDALEAYGLFGFDEEVEALEDELSTLDDPDFDGGGAFFQDDEDDGLFWDDEDEEDDDDALLEALDDALDELEAEQSAAAIKEAASPEWDVCELEVPNPVLAYRAILDGFMGERRVLPRPIPARRNRRPILTNSLDEVLHAGLNRARSSFEQRRAKVWVSSVR